MSPATAETPFEIKARGAFYTPPELTRFLAAWAVRAGDDRVLEPSCGDGAFLAALVNRYAELGTTALESKLIAVERDVAEAIKAHSLAPTADLRAVDFFDLDPASVEPVDAAIGNPPYIRYHGFVGADRAKALARAAEQGVGLTNLASSWAHFVIHAAAFLKTGGRLALVLPAELLHTDYGAPVRDLLRRRFASVIVIAFDRMVFADAQVDAVLLLASQDDQHGIRVIRVEDEKSLSSLDLRGTDNEFAATQQDRWSGAVDRVAGRVYEDVLKTHRPVQIGTFASVDIGFVSGANDFFVLTADRAAALGLPASALSATVRRPSDVPGLMTKDPEIQWLLALNGEPITDPALSSYLAHGEELGVSRRYKPRNRKRWYSVHLPTRDAHGFIPYMSHHGPRFVVNRHRARSTNLLHGVSLQDGAPTPEALAVAMASSLTLLSAEIEGRAYGGGVLKLETREAERVVVPRIDNDHVRRLEAAHADADEMIRDGRVRDAARLADDVLGLDHDRLWQAYATFRDRRLIRGSSRRRARRGEQTKPQDGASSAP